MRISNYSLIKFKVTFKIPANNYIDHIVVKDIFVNGLNYTLNDAKVFIDNTLVTTGVHDNSTSSSLNLTLDNSTLVSSFDKEINIIIPCLVIDADLLIDFIKNAEENLIVPSDVTIITCYDNNNSIINQLLVLLPLDFQKCSMNPFISPYTVKKTPYTPFYLTFIIPGIGSYEPNNLEYLISITPDYNCFIPSTPLETIIYVGDMYKNKLLQSQYSVSSPHGPSIDISFPHLDIMKNEPIYILVKLLVNTSIYTFTGDLGNNLVRCDLRYLNPSGTPETLCTTGNFNVPTYLTKGIAVITLN